MNIAPHTDYSQYLVEVKRLISELEHALNEGRLDDATDLLDHVDGCVLSVANWISEKRYGNGELSATIK